MNDKRVVRVGRRISLFVEVLGRVLRERMQLNIVEHEHWEFVVGNSTTLKYFGMETPDPEASQNAWQDFDRQWGNQVAHTFAIGAAQVFKPVSPKPLPIEIRAHLQYVHPNRDDGDWLLVSVWVQYPDGEINRGTFSCDNHGGVIDPYENDKTPLLPPEAIAFRVAPMA
ncbi:MAG: hypothetical protein WCW26_02725 [Candidatus Buchananbacteria bacterium]